MIQNKLRVQLRLKYQPESSFQPRVWVKLGAARHRKLGSQKKLVLAQGSPSEEALSRNLFFVTTGVLWHSENLPAEGRFASCALQCWPAAAHVSGRRGVHCQA